MFGIGCKHADLESEFELEGPFHVATEDSLQVTFTINSHPQRHDYRQRNPQPINLELNSTLKECHLSLDMLDGA